jgi:hypothetical protein
MEVIVTLLTSCFEVWKARPLEVTFAEPAPRVLRNINGELERSRRKEVRTGYLIKGRIYDDGRVALVATRPNFGSSWQRILYARVRPHGSGAHLAGRFRCTRFTRSFVTAAVVFILAYSVIESVGAVSLYLAGRNDQALKLVMQIVIFVAAVLLGWLFAGRMIRLSIRNEDRLIEWLQNTLGGSNPLGGEP